MTVVYGQTPEEAELTAALQRALTTTTVPLYLRKAAEAWLSKQR